MSFKVTDFVDPQGTTYAEAYFEISTANLMATQNSRFNNRISIGEVESNDDSDISLQYQVYYWTSEQAKLDGKLPYLLANAEPMGDTFYVSNLGNEYVGLAAEAAAEMHCQANI